MPPVAPDADPLRVYAAAYRDATKARSNRSATVEAVWRSYAGALPALLMLAGLIVAAARLDFPALVLVVALGLRINGALTTTLGAGRSSASAFESIRRLMATLQLPAATGGDAPPPADTTLRFAGVTFAYPGAAEPVLRDVEFVAERGSVTAIVGPSGSGKTTLMRLAAGFWAPDSGTVELGGVALQAISSDALAQRVTCVFQDVALLDDTIAANLRLGRPDADDAMLVQAARAAGADEFISALPDDYQTVVGDRGLRLSRGERQRLQIARALLRDAPIILLDEPTASLDPATESEIQDALVSLVRGKTVLTVTHRLGTIVDADRIVVLDGGGRVEAIGTHGAAAQHEPDVRAPMGRLHRCHGLDRGPRGAGRMNLLRSFVDFEDPAFSRAAAFATAAAVMATVPLACIAYVLHQATIAMPSGAYDRRRDRDRRRRDRRADSARDRGGAGAPRVARPQRRTAAHRTVEHLRKVPARTLASLEPGQVLSTMTNGLDDAIAIVAEGFTRHLRRPAQSRRCHRHRRGDRLADRGLRARLLSAGRRLRAAVAHRQRARDAAAGARAGRRRGALLRVRRIDRAVARLRLHGRTAAAAGAGRFEELNVKAFENTVAPMTFGVVALFFVEFAFAITLTIGVEINGNSVGVRYIIAFTVALAYFQTIFEALDGYLRLRDAASHLRGVAWLLALPRLAGAGDGRAGAATISRSTASLSSTTAGRCCAT